MAAGRDGGDSAVSRPPGAADDAGGQAPVSIYPTALAGRDHALPSEHPQPGRPGMRQRHRN